MVKNIAPVMLLVAAVLLLVAYASMKPDDGGKLFVRENCTKCHVLRGQGLGVIDLTHVGKEKSRTWIRDQIRDPSLHNPHPGMPSFADLSHGEVDALVDYIEGEQP